MPILDAVNERLEPALETTKRRFARAARRVARADLATDDVLSGAVDAMREWLAPRVVATKQRLAPRVEAAKERMAPVAEAAKERLAPVVEPLAPVLERVRDVAVEFGETAVGTVPEAEEVADPVGELRGYFDIQDTMELDARELKAAIAASAGDEEELEVPPYESWALSTLDEEPPGPAQTRSDARETASVR